MLLGSGLSGLAVETAQAQTEALPSWNDGAAKKSVIEFVTRVTAEGGADFVPVEQRIATLDNDGTLWCEQPIYFQAAFAFDRMKAMAKQHPEWKTTQPFEAVLDKDVKALAASGEKGLLQIVRVRAGAWNSCGRGWKEATAKNWTVVDMKQDWKRIFPFEK